jgi:hypothetical protein
MDDIHNRLQKTRQRYINKKVRSTHTHTSTHQLQTCQQTIAVANAICALNEAFLQDTTSFTQDHTHSLDATKQALLDLKTILS